METDGPFSSLWNNRIAKLLARDGERCHYCQCHTHMRRDIAERRLNDATIDHKIPRSRGGSNDLENLLLACRKCNEAKEDRTYEDFVARPYRLKANGTPVRRSRFATHPAVQAILRRWPGAQIVDERVPRSAKGTLARAIENGEVDPAGRYRKAPRDIPLAKPKPAQRMSAEETARWLRESAEKKGKPWPLA